MTEKERFTQYKEGCQAWKQWQKKYPNPFDLENILHNENIRLKDNDSGKIFYVNIRAMEENSYIFKGRIAFIGVTVRRGQLFDMATREEENEIKKFLDDKLAKISKEFNCSYTRAD